MNILQRAAARYALRGMGRKESAAGAVISSRTHGRPAPRMVDVDDYAREGYTKNVIAFRCVKEIAQAGAAVPVNLFQGENELDLHAPAWEVLRRPNPMQAWQAYVTDALSHYQIAGNSYLEAVGADGRPPSELWTLRPGRVEVLPGQFGMPAGYRYKIGGDKKDYEVDPITGVSDIRHLKTFNPLDDWYGMSPIQAAAVGINQFNESGEWNQGLLLRGASRGGVLEMQASNGSYDVLSDPDYELITKRLEEQFSGPQNAGRWKIAEGGLKFTETSFSPQDMDWIDGKNTSARDICGAFGFPCQLLGIPGDNTYSNYREARQAFYENTVMPLIKYFLDELNAWLMPRFGDGLRLEADEDQVLGLSPRREAVWDRVKGATHITEQEKRDATGYGPWEANTDPANQLTQPANVLPLGFSPEDEAAFEKGLRADGVSESAIVELKQLAFGQPNGEWRDNA